MSTCEATSQLHHEYDRFQKYLICDLELAEHAGLNHHDPVHGVWWSRCDLDDHGHPVPAGGPDAESESWEGPGVDVTAMIEAADERRRAAQGQAGGPQQ